MTQYTPCRHTESREGRCVRCGRIWIEQATDRREKQEVGSHA